MTRYRQGSKDSAGPQQGDAIIIKMAGMHKLLGRASGIVQALMIDDNGKSIIGKLPASHLAQYIFRVGSTEEGDIDIIRPTLVKDKISCLYSRTAACIRCV